MQRIGSFRIEGEVLTHHSFGRFLINLFAVFGMAVAAVCIYLVLVNGTPVRSFALTYLYVKNKALHPISNAKLIEGATRGMVEALEDPYSTYLSKTEYEDLRVRVEGSFSGVGMVFGAEKDGSLRVVAPIKHTPASEAGIKSGDLIIKINGESTKGMNVDQAQQLIRGKSGTPVRLTIYREANKTEKEYRLIRRNINVPSVDSHLVKGHKNIGYLQITQFTNKSAQEFVNHLNGLINRDAEALILDLRDDPGGDFEAALKIADVVLAKGTIVKVADRKGPVEADVASAPGIDMPIIILVNGGSASASEILAGALKDNNAAILVGEKTFGKGLVQTIIPLAGGSYLKLTTNKYTTPSGADINKIGIAPAYTVHNPPDGKTDLQMEKAVLLLEEKLADR
ncbi:MAG: S41 family peptidase [Solirubrobacterales bacterium]